ncbi:hypothetical protein L596_015248 [Steinernema carpocapsae]|uniref:Uncharacterized protein n=1 Tax=Steinernema carpocapsae TaxID=34508 RepID=A0A4U5NEM6_STECR|nr:hypothetical protein L596_015248 [Steinernema carpocapsae]
MLHSSLTSASLDLPKATAFCGEPPLPISSGIPSCHSVLSRLTPNSAPSHSVFNSGRRSKRFLTIWSTRSRLKRRRLSRISFPPSTVPFDIGRPRLRNYASRFKSSSFFLRFHGPHALHFRDFASRHRVSLSFVSPVSL